MLDMTFQNLDEEQLGSLRKVATIKYEVTKPFKMEHVYQVQVDENSEFGFQGLPEEWEVILK